MLPATGLFCSHPDRAEHAHALAQRFALPLLHQRPPTGYWLELDDTRLSLLNPDKHGPVYAEFVEGAAAHRRQFGGGRGQPVAKAIGMKGQEARDVVDATAGLGRDAFVLASLGCRVRMVERSPVAAALLADALARASADADTADIAARMTVVHADASQWLASLDDAERPQVVFVDPMFPDTGNKAAAKKEMQAFQQVIGDDEDSDRLLMAALCCARERVVVKRPRLGVDLAGPMPSSRQIGKSTRFDVYSVKALAAVIAAARGR